MLSVRTVSAKSLEYFESAQPEPGIGEALIKVEHVTLCGTDLHIWEDDYTSELPLVQGHEIAGTVVALGETVQGTDTTEVSVGERIVIDPLISCGECRTCRRGRANVCPNLVVLGCYCDGGFAEYLSVSVDKLHRLPDGLPTELGPVAEPAAISLEAVTRGRAEAGDTVLVLGAGPIGLLSTLALHDLGATVVTADTNPDRVEMATSMGSDHTLLINPGQPFPSRELSEMIGEEAPDGPDLVIEATGLPASLENALRAVAPAGRVVQVGISAHPTSFPLNLVPFKEIDLLGSRNSQGLMPEALKLISRHVDTVRSLITHRFDVTDLDSAFRTLGDRTQRVGKVLIDMPRRTR
ncbi:zinc-dependent alcohol dehydrogenase [Brevibacterium zhoupengii]|uniref:zinc-dependent alcohol dehydrogenase n=1 Tax=Brevibacterium zhoupengii TaxID=2898795 RepID=UPI001E53B413|nr:alcohol dehydrogenase catalytic domain-containing protein [Brevibacterium zhoupengii]